MTEATWNSKRLARRDRFKRIIDKAMPHQIVVELKPGVKILLDMDDWKYRIAERLALDWRGR